MRYAPQAYAGVHPEPQAPKNWSGVGVSGVEEKRRLRVRARRSGFSRFGLQPGGQTPSYKRAQATRSDLEL